MKTLFQMPKQLLPILIWGCFFISNTVVAQEKIQISDSVNVDLLQNIDPSALIAEQKTMDYSVEVFKVKAPELKNHFHLIIRVKEFDEYAAQNVFQAGPFYKPEFIKWEQSRLKQGFQIESERAPRKLISMAVDLKQLQIHEINTLPK